LEGALAGRLAVVTGASRGLGAEIAGTLARSGARIGLVARDSRSLAAVARHIVDEGGVCRAFPADVSQVEAVESMAADLQRELGEPDILVNAAGVFGPLRLLVESSPAAWVETIMVNLVGPYLTARAFAPGMVARGFGRIINVSSAGALYPPGALDSAYVTSKVALNQLTRHLAVELEGTGVAVTAIHPGDVKTDMWREISEAAAQLGPEGREYREWAAMVGESGGDPPAKAAELVLRLATDPDGSTSGRFVYIDEPLQPPLPSWD
jgi:NAD(P)-dependent dehydrogenase (short-subunit alcohol dehydrogenase family)